MSDDPKPKAPQPVPAGPGPVAAAAQPAPEPKVEERKPSAPPVISAKAFRQKTRREVLKLTPIALAGAFTIMSNREWIFGKSLGFTDWATGLVFSQNRLARTFSDKDVVAFENFPYNGYDEEDPGVDLENWTLTVEGAVARPGEYTLEDIHKLPKFAQNIRHVCVEGWDAIGSFGGTRITEFLKFVGADANARFLEVECADDYYESIDMASAMHPQSLLCYEMYGQPLDRGHGAPLRLHMATKLGYKQAKYITTLRVSNVLKPDHLGYWPDQGYDWYGGL
jgi:DMSO/TMAO reductase YedYZ molybdopterin-dependent catalytic subunit